MKINLQEDATKILDYVRQRVKEYDPATNGGPGDGQTVYQIDIGFAHTQWGFLALVFDTRPDAEPDGEWNSYIEESSLELPHWGTAFEALCEGETIEFTHRDGRTEQLSDYPGEEEYAGMFGEMLKELLLEVRATAACSPICQPLIFATWASRNTTAATAGRCTKTGTSPTPRCRVARSNRSRSRTVRHDAPASL